MTTWYGIRDHQMAGRASIVVERTISGEKPDMVIRREVER